MELKDLGLQRINLDLSNNITENFFAKEGDVGTRGLSIKVLNNSVEIDTTGVSITMYARVGQEVYSVDAIVKDALKGEYELIYPTSILKSGIVYAELQLKKLNDIISTKKFKILVESGIVTDSAIEGMDSYPIFEQLLEAGANEEERIANEEIRKLNEIARIDAEDSRVSEDANREQRILGVEEDLTAHKENYAKLVDAVTELSHITQKYTVDSWQKVQDIVRAGLGNKAFRIGDQFVAEFDDTIHIWEAVRVEDDALTIQSRDCLLNAQFSAPQALYKVKTDPLSAGTYHVTISEVKYQFTTTVSIPVGGIITFPWAYATDILTTKPQTFSSQLSTAALETMSISAGSGGTELTGLNHIDRCRFGSNNYKESALRQWLNSDLSNWSWTAQTDYDRPSNYGDSRGFIKRLDPELAAVIGETENKVARNTITDGGGQDTVTDKVFLLSQKEVGLGTEGDTTGEIVYPYYDGVTNADRIKLLANSPRIWSLRSPLAGHSGIFRFVRTTGALSGTSAYDSIGVAPACRIR